MVSLYSSFTLHWIMLLWGVLLWGGLWSGCSDVESQGEPSEMIEAEGEVGDRSVDALNLICGDGVCHPSETVDECEQDCAFCGDGVCSSVERAEDCPRDCEDSASRALDQGPMSINQEI